MKLAQVRNVPEIRFKIFGGYWSFKRLGYFASQVKNKNYDQAESYALTNSAKYGIVGQEEYFDREIAKNENLAKYYVVHIGDFIYNPRKSATASAGPIKRNRCAKGVISPIYTVFRFSTGNLDFFEHYFNSTKWHRHMKRIANYGARFDRLNITRTDFFNLPMPCISEEEQQQIATFLSSVDTKIEQLCEKKELLELYKKGIMQKLFSQEIRFKDERGNDYPNWEQCKLGNLGTSFNGLTGKNSAHFGKGKPYIQYLQVFENSRIDVDEFGFVEMREDESQNKVCSGDVFFTTSSETPNEVGTASVLIDEVENTYLNSFCFGYRVNQNYLLPEYARYAFRDNGFRKRVVRLAQGSTRYNLSKTSLMKIETNLPSLHEQQKIADFLSAFDKKIELVAEQLEQARTFKKGLLQKMFI